MLQSSNKPAISCALEINQQVHYLADFIFEKCFHFGQLNFNFTNFFFSENFNLPAKDGFEREFMKAAAFTF